MKRCRHPETSTEVVDIKQMLIKEAKLTRQSPLQKAAAFGEGMLRAVGTARGLWEAGKTVYGAAQAIAPYAQAAISIL